MFVDQRFRIAKEQRPYSLPFRKIVDFRAISLLEDPAANVSYREIRFFRQRRADGPQNGPKQENRGGKVGNGGFADANSAG